MTQIFCTVLNFCLSKGSRQVIVDDSFAIASSEKKIWIVYVISKKKKIKRIPQKLDFTETLIWKCSLWTSYTGMQMKCFSFLFFHAFFFSQSMFQEMGLCKACTDLPSEILFSLPSSYLLGTMNTGAWTQVKKVFFYFFFTYVSIILLG